MTHSYYSVSHETAQFCTPLPQKMEFHTIRMHKSIDKA